MCNTAGPLAGISRRSFVQAALAMSGAAVASTTLSGCTENGDVAAAGPAGSSSSAADFRTRLVLLGTAAGRTWWGGSERKGISTAVVVENSVYLVDFGEGWARRYLQAGLGRQEEFHGLERLEAAFVTHLHSDHIVDYPNILTFGSSDGLANRPKPLQVFGPGPRPSLVPLGNSDAPEPPVLNASNPTPGLRDTTEYLYQAFANDLNDNMRDSLKPDPHSLITVHDIELPVGVAVDPNIDVAPRMSPFPVFEDERVRVSATLVDHAPVFPAFAFRFDTADGSVVVSGDTNACDNLVELARGADMLVHEVIDIAWVKGLFPDPPSPAQQAKIEHLVNSHTPIEDVGKVAERAGVRTLVLTHLAPADNPPERWLEAKNDFSGEILVGEDLMELGVGVARRN
jgi:ribonuclease BN (tRNA processing enzyme)